jgi:chromosomal replication initiation ATPase DnaA
MTSDRAPQAIPTLEERLRSRFAWGMIADLQPPTLETRIAILQAKADSLGYRVPDDVLTLIAQRAQAKGIKQVVFDRGGYIYHGRVAALAAAAREAGLEF